MDTAVGKQKKWHVNIVPHKGVLMLSGANKELGKVQGKLQDTREVIALKTYTVGYKEICQTGVQGP